MASNYTKPEVWWTDRDSIAIATQNSTTGELTGPSVGTVTLFVVKNATAFGTTLTQVPDLPTRFHSAVVAKAIQRGYELKDPKIASYWDMQYTKYVMDAKKASNKARDGSHTYAIRGYDY